MRSVEAWLPYCGPGPGPAELWGRWNLDPVLLALLVVLAIAYAVGGAGRLGARPAFAVAAGGVLVLALISPLCALSSALFSARAVHHLLLVAGAAPLIAWAVPASWLRRTPGLVSATAIHAGVFWVWHAPAAYSAALSNTPVYAMMVASLLASAWALWSAVRNAPALPAAAGLLATMVQMGLLGALLTFAPTPLYEPHFATTWFWGLTPLQDQQLAGLIMWAPALAFYLLPALFLVGHALRVSEQQARSA